MRYVAELWSDTPETGYRFVSLWDSTHQRWVELQAIEVEYMRRVVSLRQFAIHSKRAARRRLKRYLAIWNELHNPETGRGG